MKRLPIVALKIVRCNDAPDRYRYVHPVAVLNTRNTQQVSVLIRRVIRPEMWVCVWVRGIYPIPLCSRGQGGGSLGGRWVLGWVGGSKGGSKGGA